MMIFKGKGNRKNALVTRPVAAVVSSPSKSTTAGVVIALEVDTDFVTGGNAVGFLPLLKNC